MTAGLLNLASAKVGFYPVRPYAGVRETVDFENKTIRAVFGLPKIAARKSQVTDATSFHEASPSTTRIRQTESGDDISRRGRLLRYRRV